MRSALADPYKSASQRARVISEDWAETNLYCPACPSDSLTRLDANTKSIDFECDDCRAGFQLKSGSRQFGGCILDGAYATMRETILSERTPNLLTLHYDLASWSVVNLAVIPSFAFTLSCLQKRKELSPEARRAGWVGCNILLSNIPPDARIVMVCNGVAEEPRRVRKQFARLKPIAAAAPEQRGWTLDVLNVVRGLRREVFTLQVVLKGADELARLHPENKHVPDKIRQQLQRLRDLGFLEFVDNKGTYRLKD